MPFQPNSDSKTQAADYERVRLCAWTNMGVWTRWLLVVAWSELSHAGSR